MTQDQEIRRHHRHSEKILSNIHTRPAAGHVDSQKFTVQRRSVEHRKLLSRLDIRNLDPTTQEQIRAALLKNDMPPGEYEQPAFP